MNNQSLATSVKNLYRYPLKSVTGESLNCATILSTGVEFDRHWMLVDENGKFISQRKLAKMALIKSRIENNKLLLTIPGQEEYQIVSPATEVWRDVQIWKDQLKALIVSDEVDKRLSEYLQTPCQLVEMSEQQPRAITDKAAEGQVSFADGFPYLLIGTAALENLNNKLEKSIAMVNFRPNLVVTTTSAHEEDGWHEIRIGDVYFQNVKPCSRCIMTTIDPKTAIPSADNEPLASLSKYRKKLFQGVLFGCNLIALNEGKISQGDGVEIISYK